MPGLKTKYVFVTHLTHLFDYLDGKKVVASSNVRRNMENIDYRLSFKSLSSHFEIFSDSSLLMTLNMLLSFGCTKVSLIGFDGFGAGNNFYKTGYERGVSYATHDMEVSRILPVYGKVMEIRFSSRSEYEKFLEGKDA